MNRTGWAIAAIVGALLLAAKPAQADLIGGPDIIAAPASVADDAPGATNDHQQGFNEKQDYTLLRNIRIDNVAPFATDPAPYYVRSGAVLGIARGTTVDSHMIFLNTPVGTASTSDRNQTWRFAGTIIGVMSDPSGLFESGSNVEVANPGTFYPGSFAARGMESADSYSVSADRLSLTVSMTVTEPGDWIRVITVAEPVPEPGTLVLCGAMLAGAVYLRRRRRA